MENYNKENAFRMIREGKCPDMDGWTDIYLTMHREPSYVIMENGKRKVLTDSARNRYIHFYFQKPDTEESHSEWYKKLEPCCFDTLLDEIQLQGIHILFSETLEEAKSLLLENPSGFMFFVNVSEDLEAGTVTIQ